jgi:hypothetical protein
MQQITVEQLRAAHRAGGIASVTLTADGGAFVVALATRGGDKAVLITMRGKAPRRFRDPGKAMLLLRGLGIVTARIDASRWKPGASEAKPRPDRAAAMKQTHQAAAYDRWFRAEVEAGLREANDPNTVFLSHEDAMAEMKAAIDRVAAKSGRRAR